MRNLTHIPPLELTQIPNPARPAWTKKIQFDPFFADRLDITMTDAHGEDTEMGLDIEQLRALIPFLQACLTEMEADQIAK